MKTFKIYSPSFKRGSSAITHRLFYPEDFCYVIEESDLENYKHLGAELMVIPKEKKSRHIADCRNYILENKTSDYVVMVDDDIKMFERCYKRVRTPMDPSEICDMIIRGFQMAEDAGVGLWGINVQNDMRFYKILKPFCFSNVVLGPFSAILDNELRYDTTLPLKEDYDYFLQSLNKYRRVLRFDMYSYLCDHGKMAGGCVSYRTSQVEKENFDLLVKKWGSDLIKKNNKTPGSINPIINSKI